jgi:hypothetical protein
MALRAEPTQLHPLAVDDLLGVAVAPLDGHLARGVGVDEHIEGAVALQLREEGDGSGDLPEDGGYLGLDLGFGFFFFFLVLLPLGRVLLLVGWGCGRLGLGGFGFGLGEDLDLSRTGGKG